MTITQLAPLPLAAPPPRQGARGLRRRRRPPAARRDRSRERVRRRDGRADSVQGRGAHADHRVVAAPARGRRSRITCSSSDADEIVDAIPALAPTSRRRSPDARCSAGAPRSFPIECVIRGYLSGSAWKEYAQSGTLAGESLPPDMRESDRLDPPLFSPATKAESGHDENITVAQRRRDARRRRRARARAIEPPRLRARSRQSPPNAASSSPIRSSSSVAIARARSR